MNIIKKYWDKLILFLILVLAGFLTFYNISNEGFANTYYSAAVKSMLTSWHNFFFASFDSGGYVTVDKPALGLWLQAISAYIFGFYGWSLILPEALSTVISVAILYHLVKRTFGKIAGLISALVLALSPILIAVSRTNNLDASLVMVVLLAAWALIAASERGSIKLLLLSMAFVGLGFNIKMLEAFMVLPGFYLAYMFGTSLKWGKKLGHMAIATVVLMVVSLSWAVIVDLTPADKRPYIGSSQTNSVMELALGYNGIQRVVGMNRDDGKVNFQGDSSNGGNSDRSNRRNAFQDRQRPQGSMMRPSDGNMPGGNGGPVGPGATEGGKKGALRLFNQQMAGQASWLIPMALFGVFVLILKLRKSERLRKKGILRNLLLWAGWIIPMFGYFSIAGYFHRYYLSMLTPGLAALSGIAVIEMWREYRGSSWRWILLPISIITNAAVQAVILSRYSEWRKILTPVVCGICLASVLVLVLVRLLNKYSMDKVIKASVAVGVVALLIAPSIWSYTPIMYGSQTTQPVAGPELKKGSWDRRSGQGGVGSQPSSENVSSEKLISFLQNNKKGEKYLVAVSSAMSAAPIILKTGEAVMAVGGFKGSDKILTVEKLEKMVRDGELRYFMTQGWGSQSEISKWVEEHGEKVSSDKWNEGNIQGRPGQFGSGMELGGVLYDLAPEKGTA